MLLLSNSALFDKKKRSSMPLFLHEEKREQSEYKIIKVNAGNGALILLSKTGTDWQTKQSPNV